MENLKVAVEKALRKRDMRLTRSRNIHKAMRSNTLDAIAQLSSGSGGNVVISHDESGVVRLKILVKKQDLKQVVDQLTKNRNINEHRSLHFSMTTTFSLEHRLNLMRRRHNFRASTVKASCRSSSLWRPALQSIPEEF